MARPGAIGVDVWSVPLGGAGWDAEVDLALLSLDERERHARFLVPEPARIFATTRAALRRLLGARLGRPPASVVFSLDPDGKPFLPEGGPFFSVSHASSRALIAICDEASVGVDIEYRAGGAFDVQVAAQLCSPAETRHIEAGADAVDAALWRLWCRKEAVLKASGEGVMRRPMAELDLGDPAATEGEVVTCANRILWRDLSVSFQEAAAVAVLAPGTSAIDVTLSSHEP